MVAVVILLRVLARMSEVSGGKLSNVYILLSGEGLTSFSINNRTNFFGQKKVK